MPTLPDAPDMGLRPTPRSNREIAVVRNAEAVGEAVGQLGGKVGELVDRFEQIKDEDDARRLDIEHAEQARIIRNRAREQRGLNAEDARRTAETELEALNQGILGRARSNRSRAALESLVARRSSFERDNVAEYARTETVNAMDASIVARRDLAIEEAEEAWQNPEAVDAALSTAVAEVRNRGVWRGQPEDQTVAEERAVRSRVRGAVVEQRLAANDYDGAAEYLTEHRGEIDHERENRYWGVINGELELQQTDENAAEAIRRATTGEGQAPADGAATRTVTPGGAAGDTATLLRGQRMAGRQPSEAVIAGFLGNAEHESGFRTNPGSGDGGTAHGMMQWRAERVANFQRIIGKHPSQATRAETVRFIAWEMNNPGAAGMTVAQRDAIMDADGPEEAARLIDRYYERSDGRSREARAGAARRYYGGVAGEGLPAADGRRVDLEAALARLEDMPISERQRRLARERIRQFAAQNAEVRGEQEDEAAEAAEARIAELGDRFTNISQLPGAGAGLNPRALRSYTDLAQNNRERSQNREASPELLLFINYTRLANPNYFTTPEFRQEVMRRGGNAAILRSIGAQQGEVLGTTAAQRSQALTDQRLWSIASPLLQAAGIDFTRLDAPPTGDREANSAARRAERQADAARRNDALEQLRNVSRIWLEANPGRVPDDATIRGWVGNMVSAGGQIRLTGDDAAVVRSMSANDRRRAEQALRRNGMPVNERNLAATYRRVIALNSGRR